MCYTILRCPSWLEENLTLTPNSCRDTTRSLPRGTAVLLHLCFWVLSHPLQRYRLVSHFLRNLAERRQELNKATCRDASGASCLSLTVIQHFFSKSCGETTACVGDTCLHVLLVCELLKGPWLEIACGIGWTSVPNPGKCCCSIIIKSASGIKRGSYFKTYNLSILVPSLAAPLETVMWLTQMKVECSCNLELVKAINWALHIFTTGDIWKVLWATSPQISSPKPVVVIPMVLCTDPCEEIPLNIMGLMSDQIDLQRIVLFIHCLYPWAMRTIFLRIVLISAAQMSFWFSERTFASRQYPKLWQYHCKRVRDCSVILAALNKQ